MSCPSFGLLLKETDMTLLALMVSAKNLRPVSKMCSSWESTS